MLQILQHVVVPVRAMRKMKYDRDGMIEDRDLNGASEYQEEISRQRGRNLRCAVLVAGIFTCLLSYGYFQEKLMTGKWGDDQIGGKDISSVFLVMCNR